MLINSTPFADGFFMPAEHTPQARVWLAWPVRGDNWRDQGVPGQAAFARFIKALVQHTPVGVAVTAAGEASARAQLPDEVKIVVVKYNDAWMRDMGPTFVVNEAGEKRAISWQFNAWGGDVDGLYPEWADDDKVASVVAVHEETDIYQAPFVLEGGSIHVDGEGTVYIGHGRFIGGSGQGGLSISTNKGTSFTTTTGTGSSNAVLGLSTDSKNNIYVVNGNGLWISKNGGSSFTQKTTSHGLVSNATQSIFVNSAGVILIGTNSGISISYDGGESFITKTTSDGLAGNQVSDIYSI